MDSLIKDISELKGLEIYNQYANDEVYYNFFKMFKQYFYDKYIKNAQNIFNVRYPSKVVDLEHDINSTDSDEIMQYFLFYYENVFGFTSPLAKASSKNLYDDNKDYDKSIKWDDMQGNGFIPISDYIIIIRYFLNYSSGSWTYGWLSKLIISYVKSTKFIIEAKLDGCIIHAVNDTKGRLEILSNIFTNRDIYGFTPLQKVKFHLLDTDSELQDEIDRIYNENDVVWQDDNVKPLPPVSDDENDVKPPLIDDDELKYLSKYTYYYDSLKKNKMPVDNEKVTWLNHCGFDCDCEEAQEYLLSMAQPHLMPLQFVNPETSGSLENGELSKWLKEKNKTYDDLKSERSLRDEAKSFLCEGFINSYVKQNDFFDLFQFVKVGDPNALADYEILEDLGQVNNENGDYSSLIGWTLGVKDGIDKSTLNWKDRPNAFVIAIAFAAFLCAIDWNVDKEIVDKRMERINKCLAVRYYAMYYGANENGCYFIYATPLKVMENELPNFFNLENFNNLHFYELAHLYLAYKCTYNTNLSRESLENLIQQYAKDMRLKSENLKVLDDDEILSIAKFLELFMLYQQIHMYSQNKQALISVVKPFYKQSNNYKKLLDTIKNKVESDFTHTKKYDIKIMLNDCNTFIKYFTEKLKIKNNEITLKAFLENVEQASMYDYLIYIFDNKEKTYYSMPHYKEIEVMQFMKAQAKLKELLSNFNDDELELTKPQDESTLNDLPNIETQYPDMLQYAWDKFVTYANSDINDYQDKNITELTEFIKSLYAIGFYFQIQAGIAFNLIQQEDGLQNLQSIASNAQITITSIDDYLSKIQDIEENYFVYAGNSKEQLLGSIQQLLTGCKTYYNQLKPSIYDNMQRDELLEHAKLSIANSLIETQKQDSMFNGMQENEIASIIAQQYGLSASITTYDDLKQALTENANMQAMYNQMLSNLSDGMIRMILKQGGNFMQQ